MKKPLAEKFIILLIYVYLTLVECFASFENLVRGNSISTGSGRQPHIQRHAKGFGSSGGGAGFGSKATSGKKKVSKKVVAKRVKKKYGGTSARDIAIGTQQQIEEAMKSLPSHLQMATRLYQQLQMWNAHVSSLSLLEQAKLSPQEVEGSQRAQDELDRLFREHDLTESDIHNIFQKITWDASADAKTARSIAGEMPKDVVDKLDRACRYVADTVQSVGGDGRCLDVGCGYGALVPSLLKSGLSRSQIFGVDLSTEMIRNAREQHPGVTFDAADFLLEYEDATGFDAIIFCASLHDLPDPIAALQKASSLLRPNGRVVVVHPQGSSHVLKQARSNPVLVKRSLPDATELQTTDIKGLSLVVAPEKLGSPEESDKGYLAVFTKR